MTLPASSSGSCSASHRPPTVRTSACLASMAWPAGSTAWGCGLMTFAAVTVHLALGFFVLDEGWEGGLLSVFYRPPKGG
jgi:hypothetical protein